LNNQHFIIYFIFVFIVLRLVRYVIGARVFLTSAVQEVVVTPCAEEDIDEGVLEVLKTLDPQFTALGFQPLGYLRQVPLLTYYDEPDYCRVFVHHTGAIEAYVWRRLAPEYGSLANVELVTRLKNSGSSVTTSVGSPIELPTISTETYIGATLSELRTRHDERLKTLNPADVVVEPTDLSHVAADMSAMYAALRSEYRRRHWCVPTSDSRLDRITMRGAIGMVNKSTKAFGQKGTSIAPAGESTELNRRLRAQVDFQCVRRVARSPIPAPGTPWPLLTVIAATAVISVVGMAALWNPQIAVLIFVVLLIHEAGHAAAMRFVGHQAVHIFFVPFLGALTIGRPTDASVRQRLVILLAGPLPGLAIGIALFAGYGRTGNALWHSAALVFLIINALNLLPVIPLDGGRYFETLTRPDGIARFLMQMSSSIGLGLMAFFLKDPVFTGFAVLSFLFLPQQWRLFRFRRELGKKLTNDRDWLAVARDALIVMTEPRFSAWRSPTRQVFARAAADQFIATRATGTDWLVGAIGYFGSIVVLVAAGVWVRMNAH